MLSKGNETTLQYSDPNPENQPPPPAYPTPQIQHHQESSQWSQDVNRGVPSQPYHQQQQPQDAATIGAQYQAAMYASCARGEHQATTKYGVCGIITCILLFPIGLICLFVDTHRECARCHVVLD